MAFHGTFDHSLDAKNRLTVPSKFRAALSGTVFVVRGSEPCLSVYPGAHYEGLKEQTLKGIPPLSAQYREFQRLFSALAEEVELDSAGRIPLKSKQLAHAGIAGRETVIAGAGDCLEIWDRAAWESYDADLSTRAAELTASLGHPA